MTRFPFHRESCYFYQVLILNTTVLNRSLTASRPQLTKSFVITGSKSESNRLLLLQALFPGISLENLSNSDDSEVMQRGLPISEGVVDIHHAGTAMRFLTAYFAASPGKEIVLTGSARMKERPVKILVDALRSLGASIEYAGEEGYPPLKISGKKLKGGSVSLPADVSSQYISALLLIAPTLEEGLTLNLQGKITSAPYIRMTLALLDRLGVTTSFIGQKIGVSPLKSIRPQTLTVESDWSSASYFYSVAALGNEPELTLRSYRKDSLQGDRVLADLYESLGVTTQFEGDRIILTRHNNGMIKEVFRADLTHAPDIAQTIAVTCFGLGIGCELTGLHTLKIKETDRLEALKTELSKLGAHISVTHNSLHLKPSAGMIEGVHIATYNDHRMAMAFAPLALKGNIVIEDAEVVSKSYPDFWKDFGELGIG